MYFTKFQKSYSNYKEAETNLTNFIRETARTLQLEISNFDIKDSKILSINILTPDFTNKCKVRLYDGHYIIENFDLNVLGQSEFLRSVQDFIKEINIDIDKK